MIRRRMRTLEKNSTFFANVSRFSPIRLCKYNKMLINKVMLMFKEMTWTKMNSKSAKQV